VGRRPGEGPEAVRDYWNRQWSAIDPSVDPVEIDIHTDGTIAVEVDQVVRDLDGTILGDGRVVHVYALREGLIARMDVEEHTDTKQTDRRTSSAATSPTRKSGRAGQRR